MLKYLVGLPDTMPLGEALVEAKRLKREHELAKDREKALAYHYAHRDEINERKRAIRASKKSQEAT